MAHISVQKLNVAYGPHKILQEINVEIPEKQITAIIGPSGCGKTTLLKSLNRLIDLYEELSVGGDVFVDGWNIYDEDADVLALRKKVGFIAQKPHPLPMSIYDNVAFGLRIHRLNRQRLIEQFKRLEKDYLGDDRYDMQLQHEMTGMSKKAIMDTLIEGYLRLAGLWEEVKGRLSHPATLLSVGQQQRLALARALAVEPQIILADEPTSALDPISAQLIEKQFRILKENYTIIVVTHIMRQARRIADYVIFLYMGELVEHGPAEEIFSAPKDKRTQAYVFGDIS
jgi:phosphate transport system ATP-binding protein